jgi:CheY-like chemotaxis protein
MRCANTPQDASANPMNVQAQNRIVLLVEDSDDDAFFFERAFANANISDRLIRVVNGAEAVEYLQKASETSLDLSPSHHVFLDLKLPMMNGFEVLKWIRERGLSLDVFVLSGSDMESDLEMARALGAADYLVKPISAEEIRKRLVCEQVAN